MFYNPYLGGGGRGRPAAAPRRAGGGGESSSSSNSFLQIVPRGVMYDGQTGLIKRNTNRKPIMFFNDNKYVLSDDMAWPSVSNPEPLAPPRGRVRFHTYDQSDGVLAVDTVEEVSPRYRRYIVPSGNVIRFFGVMDSGHSICVNVFGQLSYFYCEHPETDRLREVIYSVAELVPEPRSPYAVTVLPVNKMSIYGYGTSCVPHLHRVSISNWVMAKKIGQYLLDQGFKVYEIKVDPLTRLVVDKKLTTFGWCFLDKYEVRTRGRVSACDLELDCEVSDLFCSPEDTSWPLYRCLSFDIECLSAGGGFPAAENVDDIVIQISCVCYGTGREDAGVCFGKSGKHLFTIGSCAPIEDVDVYEFPSEYELLLGFFLFFKRYGACLVTGYNINSFDFKYMLTRLENIYKVSAGRFARLNRDGKFFVQSGVGKSYISTTQTKVTISGAVVVDMYPVCMAKTSSPNYKLNTMAELYLQQRKDDLSYKEIPVKFLANEAGRAVVGKYCVQDAVLVKDLFNIINFHYEAGAVARLAKISMRKVIFDGQQIRIYTSLLDECACRDLVLPTYHRNGDAAEESSYQGATVFEPETGYYNDPVLVFDFASLYPSIIMAHNLCYSTLVMDGGECPEEEDKVYKVSFENGTVYRFVKSEVRSSVLSELLTRWVAQRKAVRETMRECTDPLKRTLLDKEQLALKVTCNAFYGFTGVANGMLPCLPVAASITRIGRGMLQDTARFIHDNFSTPDFLQTFFNAEDYVEGGVEARVIYGDTDSVFVCYRGLKADALMASADRVAHHVTSRLFTHPVKLEFEKVFVSLMMICKKRYIGKIEGATTLSMKGVDLVRKTSCEFVKNVIKDVLALLFDDAEVSAAAVSLHKSSVELLKRTGPPPGFQKILRRLNQARDELHTGAVHVDELVLSSVLSKDISLYKQPNLPHLSVIKRLAARSEELPAVGDRVFYVLTANPASVRKKMSNYELAEDPLYVKEHQVPIHADKYFDQVLKAITNVLSPVFPRDVEKKEKFLLSMLPARVYLEKPFLAYSVKDVTYA
ncbi:DNA polymerase catalytic subunit [Aotine betaherpesvirus 1]|uniref:DNA polymerase n=2 Tax=Aotine betaherpesvirus 1 TaxID=50290 RepID=G8XUD0_9BETA|nr:DNA polymerase catalytic subunit [Aotine betaherpesvirus 1]AEV80760.1 DNA polymerase catalytic subunit [Aotine betaherpesvirus 1]